MENLKIAKTKYTMEIDFDRDSGILKMAGSSYPENAPDFFNPIIDWINEYITRIKKPIVMIIKLNYLNTSSTKCILDTFEILEKYHKSGGDVKMAWHYEKDDEDIKETGEELSEDFSFHIDFISI